MNKRIACLFLAGGLLSLNAATVYHADFEGAELGGVPADMLVLGGEFGVREEGGNRFLELPGAPLETFGVLFGPSGRDGMTVTARVRGVSHGRRYPVFGVSLGGVSGFRLLVAPAKRALEISEGDAVVKSAGYEWKPGRWTHLKLQVRPRSAGGWEVRGKAWGEGEPEPSDWMVVISRDSSVLSGKAGIWGMPFSGTAIGYDDLEVEKEGE